LEVAEVVKRGEFKGIEVAGFQVMSMLAQPAENNRRGQGGTGAEAEFLRNGVFSYFICLPEGHQATYR
jgi:hypothetical protein